MLTGFGKNTKNVLSYLQKTGKYEILEYASQVIDHNPELQTLPWKARGALPANQQILNELNKDPNRARLASYGEMNVENVVKDFQSDVNFFVEDKWGIDFNKTKNFWGKIPSVFWVTQDSKPLIGVDDADATPYYWTWADFARKEFHKLGKTHVKTQYPPVDLTHFYNLGVNKTKELRNKFKISDDVFVIGDSSRNQLRKFTNLVEGYAVFRKENPLVKSILLLVTNFSEGWDIPRLAKTYGVDMKEVWTAYVSSECNEYFLHPFVGQEQKCPFTGKEKAVNTVNITKGLTEDQLNEVYNVMDVFLHPSTSGGAELTVIEAAAAERIVIVPDYSYGEDVIELNKGALCLDWAKYLEIGTQFEKSAPYPSSIAKQLKKVLNMDDSKRTEMGRLSRQWAKENYDLELNCKKIEEFIDSLPLVDWSTINLDAPKANPNYQLPPNYKDLSIPEFINLLYKEILNRDADKGGFDNWFNQLNNNVPREQVYQFFIKVAIDEVQKNTQTNIWDIIDKDRPQKRGLITLKESIGDALVLTQLFESFHEQYPSTDLYICCEPKVMEVFEGNPHVHKIIPFNPIFTQEMAMISSGGDKNNPLFHYFFFPAISTQVHLNYLSNSNPILPA
jgi:glycosyltransferase involved in cell wall biosynthesis